MDRILVGIGYVATTVLWLPFVLFTDPVDFGCADCPENVLLIDPNELDGARGELDHALAELRELARGIHPSILTDRGLDAALHGLARRAPLPVELRGTPAARLPDRVESVAYFVVAEALTNVAKYARATHASVNVRRQDGQVLVEIADDGVGGADPATGSGLRGLLDHVAAVGGRLELDSPSGQGTTVRAAIPL